MTTLTDTFHTLPKILIAGYGEHGKDEFAERLVKHIDFTFVSSSRFACDHIVFPWFDKYFPDLYRNSLGCFNDRRHERARWHTLISEYNTPDKAKLAREIMSKNDVYIGMRCKEEFAACQEEKLFNLVFWVDASSRKPREDSSSCSLHYDPETMIYVDNNGTLEDINKQAVSCANLIRKSTNR